MMSQGCGRRRRKGLPWESTGRPSVISETTYPLYEKVTGPGDGRPMESAGLGKYGAQGLGEFDRRCRLPVSFESSVF
ncbi:hypothetical protein GCM10023319_78240 [Nocardia iowensis]